MGPVTVSLLSPAAPDPASRPSGDSGRPSRLARRGASGARG